MNQETKDRHLSLLCERSAVKKLIVETSEEENPISYYSLRSRLEYLDQHIELIEKAINLEVEKITKEHLED